MRAARATTPRLTITRPNPRRGAPTYADYERTGRQDCQNVIDLDLFELVPGKSARQIVDDSLDQLERVDGLYDTWMDQNADDVRGNELDPDEAYVWWKAGWKGCAVPYVEREMTKRRNPPAGGEMRDWLVIRIDKDNKDTYAVPYDGNVETSIEEALDLALPDDGSVVEYAWVRAKDAGAARLKKPTPNNMGQAWQAASSPNRLQTSYVSRWRAKRETGARGNPGRRRNVSGPDDAADDPRVLEGMARALWVTSYADWVENIESDAKRKRLSPGPGGDWSDAAPATPSSADEAAEKLARMFYAANGLTLGELLKKAVAADRAGGQRASVMNDDYAESFGHYLAMEALGHGVSWFDDHESFEIQWPFHFKAHTFDGKKLTFSGRAGR